MKRNHLYYIIVALGVAFLCVLGALLATLFLGGPSALTPEEYDTKGEGPSSPGAVAPERGVYYCVSSDHSDEYTLTLNADNQFILSVRDNVLSGTYALNGESLTFTLTSNFLSKHGTLRNDTITLVYQNMELTFLRKKYFTVIFDTVGGSDLSSVTVLHGKTLSKPVDPTREGYIFLGWYVDESYQVPFVFDSVNIFSDITLHARWAERTAWQNEYTVTYDLGYAGEVLPESRTVGGHVYNVPTPAERDGYVFGGWWISSENCADKLSYRFEEPSDTLQGTRFDADTTLFAVWNPAGMGISAPLVSMYEDSLVWEDVGAAAYHVRVIAPTEEVVLDQVVTGQTGYPITLELVGEYRAEVTALDETEQPLAEATVRYMTYHALPRVSGFTVADPAVLIFGSVPHAEKYVITVECGNHQHVHTQVDNARSLYYSFANCDMQPGGIRFTVTAMAEGYAPSTVTYVYERHLEPMSDLSIAQDVLTWRPVRGATSYEVWVGDQCYTVTSPQFSLGAFGRGTYELTVTPVARGYNSPAPARMTYHKQTMARPSNLRLQGTYFSWDAVAEATSYEVKIRNSVFVLEGDTILNVANVVDWEMGEVYEISITAISEEAASATETLTVGYGTMSDTLTYAGSCLRWRPVVGAVSYDVQINDGEIVTLVDGRCMYEVANLTRAGENVLRVRYSDGKELSAWVEICVTAYTVTLDSQGGDTSTTLYKAVGDRLVLPQPQKIGHTFVAWYNLPGGPGSNGAMYSDGTLGTSSDLVLYAYYIDRPFTVHLDDGNDDVKDVTHLVYYQKEFAFTVPTVEDGTVVFGGWYSQPNGRGIAYTDAKGQSLAPWSGTETEVTVYAYWMQNILTFTPVSGGLAVAHGVGIGYVTEITIPSQHMGVPVVAVADQGFADCAVLRCVTIPSSVTRIGEEAFANCTVLSDVHFLSENFEEVPQALTVEARAFRNCCSLTSIAFPARLTSLCLNKYTPSDGVEGADHVFLGCTALAEVHVVQAPYSVYSSRDGVLMKDGTLMYYPEAKKASIYEIPQSITALQEGVFYGVRLDTLVLHADIAPDVHFLDGLTVQQILVQEGNPAYVTVDEVLYRCNADGVPQILLFYPAAKRTTSLTVPDGVTTIADHVFQNQRYIERVTLPASLTSIGAYAFARSQVKVVTFASGVSDLVIGDYAFRGAALEDIFLPEATSVIGTCAFSESQLTAIVIPAGLHTLGDRSFYHCTELVSATIMNIHGIEYLGTEAFYACDRLASLSFGPYLS